MIQRDSGTSVSSGEVRRETGSITINFIKANGKAALIGLFVVCVWAFLDHLSAKFGHQIERSYWDTFWGALAGSGMVFTHYALSGDR